VSGNTVLGLLLVLLGLGLIFCPGLVGGLAKLLIIGVLVLVILFGVILAIFLVLALGVLAVLKLLGA